MALSGSPAGKAVLDSELCKIGLLEIALLYGEGGYHLIVGKRYVSCACGLGYIRVLHLGGEFVDVSDLEAVPIQGIGHKGAYYGLGGGAGAHAVTAQYVQVDLWAYAIVLSDYYGEPAQHILKYGQALLNVILAVHAKLCGAAAGGHGNGLVCAGSHEGCCLYHGVGGRGAEAAAVGAGGIAEAGYFSR